MLLNGGPLGTNFLYFRVSFFRYFFEAPFRAAWKPKELISGPPGGRNSCSRLHAVLYFRNRHFHEKFIPGGDEVFFGSLLGILFGHFFVFVAPSFFKPFWGPPRVPKIIVFVGGRQDADVIWR